MDDLQSLCAELQQTRLAYKMMGYLHQFKTGFLARTSHELRSPLSSLMGLHQLILADLCESPAEEREFIAQSYQAAEKLLKILDEIIQVAKISYCSIPLDIQVIQLQALLTELYQLTHLPATNKSLRLDFSVPDSIYILADRSCLLQALLMLVDTIISRQQEGGIRLSIAEQDSEEFILFSLSSACPANLWEQSQNLPDFTLPTTLEEVKNFSKKLEASPSLKFMLAQSLIEAMQGRLSLGENSPMTHQIDCWLPLLKKDGI